MIQKKEVKEIPKGYFECPMCSKVIRLCYVKHSKEIGDCCHSCWSENRRSKAREDFDVGLVMLNPRKRIVQNKKIFIYPDKILDEEIRKKEKTLLKSGKISSIEQQCLYLKLKKKGLGDKEISERIGKLKKQIYLSHKKAKETQ